MKHLLLAASLLLTGCHQTNNYLNPLEKGGCAVLLTYTHLTKLPSTIQYEEEMYQLTEGIIVTSVGKYSYDFCHIYKHMLGNRICLGSSIVPISIMVGQYQKVDCPATIPVIRQGG